MLKLVAVIVLSLFITIKVDAQKHRSFRITDFGAGLSVSATGNSDQSIYTSHFDEVPGPTGTGGNFEINNDFYPGKVMQGQLTFTQFSGCCVSRNAKSVRISLAYTNTRYVPNSMRRTYFSNDEWQTDHVDASKMKGIRPEIQLRRLFLKGDDDFRLFTGVGIQGEYSFSHTVMVKSTGYRTVHRIDTVYNSQGVGTLKSWESLEQTGRSTTKVRLDNSTMIGAYLSAGIYWPAGEGFAMELEIKAGKQARKFSANGWVTQNLFSIGICGRVLIKGKKK